MSEVIAVVLIVIALVCSVWAKVLIARAKVRIGALNHMLDLELDNVKFGPEGEATRRETAERIGRIR